MSEFLFGKTCFDKILEESKNNRSCSYENLEENHSSCR